MLKSNWHLTFLFKSSEVHLTENLPLLVERNLFGFRLPVELDVEEELNADFEVTYIKKQLKGMILFLINNAPRAHLASPSMSNSDVNKWRAGLQLYL